MLLLIICLTLATVSSKRAGGKKFAIGALNATQLHTSHAVRHTGLEERNITVHARHIQSHMPNTPSGGNASDEKAKKNKKGTTHDDSHGDDIEWKKGGKYVDGRCCKTKKTMDGDTIYRWFYWMEEDGTIKPNNGVFAKCPSKWDHTDDVRCSQHSAEIHNQVGYVEDTDWVLCCKTRGEKKNRPYFTGRDCDAKTATFKCQSYDCTWKANVNAATTECDSGYDKYTNQDPKKHCSQTSEGLTPADCAGYMADCAQAYCYIDSYSKSRDCREQCDDFEKNRAANPNTVKVGKQKKEGSYKKDDGVPLIAWAGIGVVVLIAGGLGAYMMCGSKGDAKSIPQDEVSAYNADMQAKGYGKGKGKGYDQTGGPSPYAPAYPSYDYGGQPPNSAACGYGQAPPSWGVVPMVPQTW